MTIHEFLVAPAEIAKREGPHNKIVMSSRVRLARNVKGLAFPGWAKKAERLRILEAIRPAVEALPQMSECFTETMDNLTLLDKNILSGHNSSAANTRPKRRQRPHESRRNPLRDDQ
jgi:protein-arginine kinase